MIVIGLRNAALRINICFCSRVFNVVGVFVVWEWRNKWSERDFLRTSRK
jgi:hypothetical protein